MDNKNWGPAETKEFFEQLEQTGLASCIRAIAFVVDAGLESLQKEKISSEVARIDEFDDLVLWSDAAAELDVSLETLHTWRKETRIRKQCYVRISPKKWKIERAELDRLLLLQRKKGKI